jgi:hypothetical protein
LIDLMKTTVPVEDDVPASDLAILSFP